MASVGTTVGVKDATISAVVTRCGCNDPQSHALQQLPCPTPRAVEDLGIISQTRKRKFWRF